MTDTKHTPLPWRAEEVGAGEIFIVHPDGKGGWFGVAEMANDGAYTDAQLIVARVNAGPLADELAERILTATQRRVWDTYETEHGKEDIDHVAIVPDEWEALEELARAYQKAMGGKP